MTTMTTTTKGKKTHVPAPGWAQGMSGPALCRRWSRYATGAHDDLRRLALAARSAGEAAHYCSACLARL